MIAVDTNILIHAFRPGSAHFETARASIDRLVAGGQRIAVPWPCVHEFLAISTNPRVFAEPSTIDEALDAVRMLAALDAVTMLAETPAHLRILEGLVSGGSITGGKIHDAKIAAICLGHGVTELWTADRDFSYFPALRTRNPLIG